jgi:hypothetical protein
LSKRSLGGLLLAFTAAYCIWIATLPVFPSQDGPVHLYYVEVLSHLMAGDHAPATHYFYLRHAFSPYSTTYYLLLVFGRAMSLIAAEKALVCLTIVIFVGGFWYLTRPFGDRAAYVALFAVPFAFNWALCMGFYAFFMSLAMAFWAVGLWIRAVSTQRTAYWIAFVLMLYLMEMTHPIPVILVLVFTVLHLLGVLLWPSPSAETQRFRLLLPAGFALAAASLCVVFVACFTDRSKMTAPIWLPLKGTLMGMLRLKQLSPFTGHTDLSMSYISACHLILLTAGVLAIAGFVKRRLQRSAWSGADTLLLAGLLLACAIPFLPAIVGDGGYFFNTRLLLFACVAVLGAAAAGGAPSRRVGRSVAAASVLFTVLMLSLANYGIRPVADNVARIEQMPLAQHGERGLALDCNEWYVKSLTFNPYLWSPVRYFRRTDGVLLNAPFFNMPLLMLGLRSGVLATRYPDPTLDQPFKFRDLLLKSQTDRARVLGASETVLTVDPKPSNAPNGTVPARSNPLLARAGNAAADFNCQHDNWYTVCIEKPRR